MSLDPDLTQGVGEEEEWVVQMQVSFIRLYGVAVDIRVWTASSAYCVWALKKPFGCCQG